MIMETAFKELLTLSPPFAFALGLCFLVSFLKKFVHREWILNAVPLFLGMIIYPLLTDQGKVAFGAHYPIAAQVITGFLVGCVAICGQKPFEKLINKFGLSLEDRLEVERKDIIKEEEKTLERKLNLEDKMQESKAQENGIENKK